MGYSRAELHLISYQLQQITSIHRFKTNGMTPPFRHSDVCMEFQKKAPWIDFYVNLLKQTTACLSTIINYNPTKFHSTNVLGTKLNLNLKTILTLHLAPIYLDAILTRATPCSHPGGGLTCSACASFRELAWLPCLWYSPNQCAVTIRQTLCQIHHV